MQVPIASEFFCDGAYYLLTSHSLGGSGMDPHALADTLGSPTPEAMNALLRKGVCLPLAFDGDCAMDGGTLVVLGALSERHEKAWIGRLTAKLAIPCGKLVFMCGGGDGDGIAKAISGEPADEDYFIYQTIDVPPGEYRVDVLAYVNSDTVANKEDEFDEDVRRQKFSHLPQVDESYVIRLAPLEGEVPLPPLVEEVNWPGVFEFR